MTAMSFLLEPNEPLSQLVANSPECKPPPNGVFFSFQMEVERCEGSVSNIALVTHPLLAVYILE